MICLVICTHVYTCTLQISQVNVLLVVEFTIDEESGLEGSSLLSPDPPSPPPPSYRPAVVDLPRFQRLVEQVGEEEGEGEGTKRREGTHWSTVVTEAHPNTRGQ